MILLFAALLGSPALAADDPVCGNGVVEDGEACDDGIGAECPEGWALCMHCVRCEGRALLGEAKPDPYSERWRPFCRSETPDETQTVRYDARGHQILTQSERTEEFSHTTADTYDADGRLVLTRIDRGGDGTVDAFRVYRHEPGSTESLLIDRTRLVHQVEEYDEAGAVVRSVTTVNGRVERSTTVMEDAPRTRRTIFVMEEGRRERTTTCTGQDRSGACVEEQSTLEDLDDGTIIMRSTTTLDGLGRPLHTTDVNLDGAASESTWTYDARGSRILFTGVDGERETRIETSRTGLFDTVVAHVSDALTTSTRTRDTESGWTVEDDVRGDGSFELTATYTDDCLAPLRETAPDAIPRVSPTR